MSRKVIVDTKEDKTKGQKRQTTLDTKYITKKYKNQKVKTKKEVKLRVILIKN